MAETASGSHHGKAVIVTGGGTGIGRAAAHRFAAAGADVLIAGRTAARLEEAARAHQGIRTIVADVAAPGGPAEIVEAAIEMFGRIDVLVNNAAIYRPGPLGAIDQTHAEQQLTTNVLAPVLLAQRALPHLRDGGGTIVNISSSPPPGGWPDNSVYGSTKVALDFLTRTWAVELAPQSIRVVSVAPGATQTPVLAHAGLSPAQISANHEEVAARIPLGRIAQPAEIAWWIVNLTLPAAGYINGAIVRIDGGLSVA